MHAVLHRCTILSVLTAAGCSSSLYQDYPDTAWPGLDGMDHGDFAYAARHFSGIEGTRGSDEFLGHAEAGMAWHIGGQLRRAVDEWLAAAVVLEGFGDRPTISGRSITEGALSLFINDKTIPYDGEGFEAALLHGFLAWDFLRIGDLDGAMVEVQRGYDIERFEEERYGTTYGMNRFARYVAALAQEFDSQPDEAEIDLNRLAEDVGAHSAVQYSLERVRGADRRATLVVVFERDRMPEKIEHELVFNTRRSFGQIAVPAFDDRGDAGAGGGLRVLVGGREAGVTQTLEDVEEVARSNLNDRIAWVTAKALGRTALKTAIVDRAAEEVGDKHGDLAGLLVGLLGSAVNIASESADLRSWLTLPRDIQVLRVPIEPGTYTIRLEISGAAGVGAHAGRSQPWADLGVFEFKAGETLLVGSRSLGAALHASPPRTRTAQVREDRVTP
jgi:hypothetical protein